MRKRSPEVIKARHTGFCFGVKRAIKIAESFLKNKKKAYSIGPIIHNPDVVKKLSDKGLTVIEDISKAKGANLLIRSHGISPKERKRAKAFSIGIVDATCPFVKRSHKIVTVLKKQGYKIIIIGERNHPEIKALSEVAGGSAVVVNDVRALKKIDLNNRKIAAVAQTTLSKDKFLEIAASLLNSGFFEYRLFDTICNDVLHRQAEAKELARKVSVMVVVGGKMSANTRQLVKLCKDAGTRTYHIENEKELNLSQIKDTASIGVISGASTPDETVDKVVAKLKNSI